MAQTLRAAALAPALTASALGFASDAEATPVKVQGLEDDELRRALIAILPDRDAPETALEARRVADEAAELARQWLRSEGFYQGRADPEVADGEPRLQITPGERFAFTPPQIGFTRNVEPPAAEAARDAVTALVAPAAPARAGAVLTAEDAGVRALRDAGYAGAEAGRRTAVVDHAARSMAVAFAFDPGERVRLGRLRVEPAELIDERVIARLQAWEPGALYTPESISGVRRNFSGTGMFSRVDARLAPTPGPDGLTDVLVDLDLARRRSIALGASHSTTEGIGVDAAWTLRNRFRQADTLTVDATLAEFEQSLETNLDFPHALGPDRGRRFFAGLIQEDTDAFDRRSASLGVSVEGEPRFGLATAYGLSLAADFYDAQSGVENAYILTGFVDLRNERVENRLDPRDGTIFEGRLEPAIATGDATLPFLRSTAEGRAYRSLGQDDRITLAARLGLGWVQTFGGEPQDLPLERRFYAGGGGSVRGYAYRSIFPEAEPGVARRLDEPPGGQGLLELSMEVRGRVTERIGGVAFLDGGSAFDDFGEAGELRWGAGIGARYDLGFGPLRVDVAIPLDKRPQDDPFVLYVSLGQAF